MAEDDKKQMECFEYVPEEEDDEGFTQVTRSLMDYKSQKSGDVSDSVMAPSEAFERFANTVLDTSKSDYSRAPRPSEPTAFMTPSGHRETPLEKYTKLQAEMAEFQKELQSLNKKDPEVATLLTGEVKALQDSLSATAADPKIAPFLQASYPLSSTTVTSKNVSAQLMQHMQEFTSQQQEQKMKEAADAKVAHQGMTYELFLSNYKTNDVANLADLDQRLSRLEKTIGSDTTHLPACFPDILSGLLFLQRKLNSFQDPHKREPILRRMKTLTGELEMLQEQKKNLQGAKMTEYEDKVKALYEALPAWDRAAHQLPLVLARLQSIKDVAEVGASAGAQLANLEKEQTATDALLKEGQAALDTVAASLSECVKTMQTNVGTLEAKFDEVAKQMQ